MIMKRTILITGGAGFIGSHVVRRFVRKYPEYLIINADKLTYAGNLENLTDIEKEKIIGLKKPISLKNNPFLIFSKSTALTV